MGLPCGSNNYMYSIKTNPNNNQVWFCTQAGIAIFDAGTWTIKSQLNGMLPFQNSYYDVVFDTQNNAWIASDSGLIKMTGNTWTVYNQSNSSLIANHISSLAIDSNNTIYITSYSYTFPYYGGLNIFDGVNAWQTFNAYSSPIIHHQISSVTLDKLGNVWMTTLPYGAIIYNANGVQGFECIDQSIVVTTGVTDESTLPGEKSVDVFPNPFQSSTTVELNLTETKNVSVSITDAVGKVVKNIPVKNLRSGKHKITLDLSELQNGIYFCKINYSGCSSILKMMKQN